VLAEVDFAEVVDALSSQAPPVEVIKLQLAQLLMKTFLQCHDRGGSSGKSVFAFLNDPAIELFQPELQRDLPAGAGAQRRDRPPAGNVAEPFAVPRISRTSRL
jgi:hypothetical protein